MLYMDLLHDWPARGIRSLGATPVAQQIIGSRNPGRLVGTAQVEVVEWVCHKSDVVKDGEVDLIIR